jgi:NAD-dependent dihydropyrimidine dehydrogenase PreA subunit
MRIDTEKCRGCGLCVPFCPANAITLADRKARIDEDKCLECGTCLRKGVVRCPTGAFYEPPGVYERPRSIRKFLSDPATNHKETGIPGRGTEEVKTNDVTGRVRRGFVGIGLEVGRPALGADLTDIEKLTMSLAKSGLNIHWEEDNPVTHLFKDPATGTLLDECKDQRVVSAIIEFALPVNELRPCLDTIKAASKEISTVFSLFVISRMDEDGNTPLVSELEAWGYDVRPNSKVNLGLGRPLREE